MPTYNRIRFQDLAIARLEDAESLLESGRFSAAYYLVGYTVECALKACIAKSNHEGDFPDKNRVTRSWSHDIEQLIELTDIPSDQDLSMDALLEANWTPVINKWSADVRYDTLAELEARALVAAIADPDHGVLQWLRRYW